MTAVAIAFGAIACGGASANVEAPMIASNDDGGAPLAIARAPEPPPIIRNRDLPFAPGDHWKGSYFCAQGRTALELSVDTVDDDGFSMFFDFQFPGNPNFAPAVGRFKMRGSWDGKSKTITLKADRWVDQPTGYEMIDLVGKIGGTGVINGAIPGTQGCSSFSATPDPPRKSFP